MPKNLKAFEDRIFKISAAIDRSGKTTEVYKAVFSNLTDQQKHQLVSDLREGKTNLFIMDPPLTGSKISFANNRAVAKKLFGYDFYKAIRYPAKGNIPAFVTPQKHLVLDLLIRKQSQMLLEKISVSGGRQVVDNLTGAPNSTAKTSRLSFPELQLLKSHGVDKGLLEMYTIRAGDVNGYRSYQESLINTGRVSLTAIEPHRSGVKSKATADAWLHGAHIKTNLNE